jgi:LPXTG-motif cell wall-anchored protein
VSDFWSFVIVGCLAALSGLPLAIFMRRRKKGRS